MSSDGEQDGRGTWTVTFEGGPALAGNLATAARIAARKDWPHSPGMREVLAVLAAALDSAQFTPVRPIEIRLRPPEEARARLLASPLPRDLAQALADEIAPDGPR